MDIAIYGLGVMGSNLAKNFISKGFNVAVYSQSSKERVQFNADGSYQVFDNLQQTILSLDIPHKIFLMITAGTAVDDVIQQLIPLLTRGDIIIDGGNSYFEDTIRRCHYLENFGIDFLGIGVSGGEKGALLGPSMMVGGSGWNKCKHLLQAVGAKDSNLICCEYLGLNGAGHYVKMIHNGIEYAILQVIADMYSIMKHYLTSKQILDLFLCYKNSEISSYLIDITAVVLSKFDDNELLVDKIQDIADQKGTGFWTVNEGIKHRIYIPSITEAFFSRCLSQQKPLRERANQKFTVSSNATLLDHYEIKFKNSLYAAMWICYAQGIELIKQANTHYNFDLNLNKVIMTWSAGCIISSNMLYDIKDSLDDNLIFNCPVNLIDLREVVQFAIANEIAIPTTISALSYYDSIKTNPMSTNLIQALRDCFGAHTYQRVDKEGYFHTNWE